ncbi:SnoaL-like polyketide cyclase [Colletotrichum musicola]|uniref:SnoaL-like polyketide cyclase n=1 Tax=Colletotrichum musicola TaxID=2175873 RepID=A0A8H6NGT7_9PEZI|nr:SnoaL-like polyketide cyclase [Colletotrichum musicola]
MSSQDVTATFQSFLDLLSAKKWDEAAEALQPKVIYNGKDNTNDELVKHFAEYMEEDNVTHTRMDGIRVHYDGKSIGARQIMRSEDADGKRIESWGLIMVFFENNKISRYYLILHQPHLFPPPSESLAPIPAPQPPLNPMSADELREFYHVYINGYNNGTMPFEIPKRFTEVVTLNGEPFDRDLVPSFFEKALLPIIAGLWYTVEEMVIDLEKQRIFVRLALEGVSKNERLRKDETEGGRIKVYEQAMYDFHDGRITGGWAVQGFDMTPP